MTRIIATHACAPLVAALLSSSAALAHIRIYPNESILGAVQYYADGKKEKFTGPVGSFYPTPTVTLKAAPASTGK